MKQVYKRFTSACADGALQALTTLGLRANKIGDNGIHKFSKSLDQDALPLCDILDVSFNLISAKGIKRLTKALERVKNSLQRTIVAEVTPQKKR